MQTPAEPEGTGAAHDPGDAGSQPLVEPGLALAFLFTDIEGSTRLEQRLGAARYGALRERHRQLVRAAVVAARGTERGTEGDSFFVTFATARDAVHAAADAPRALAAEPWPEDARVRVRMGIHSGVVTEVGGSLVGIDINRAARIAAAAHGGQVVASAAVRASVGESPGPGLAWLDLGEHALKDLESPERIAQLTIDGLPAEFPRLRGTAGAGDLPVSLTTFVGRAEAIDELAALLGERRLLTLTGPGGTGKTRLALEVARRAEPAFPDGAWWVPLEAIRDPDLVPATIAQRLRLPDRGGTDPVARLQQHMAGRTLLLVLDNFEQVTGAGSLVTRLLASATSLKVVVTSREALRVSGEQEYQVPPLALPDPDAVQGPDGLLATEAGTLFLERARAVQPGYAPSPADARAIAEICQRLDGLPLAIELAAARIRLLSPPAIVARLGQGMALLAGGARDLPTRQQTLRDAIAWSHEMLDADDQRLFACLSVFAGRADIEAVEEVCGTPDADVLDGLSSLVDKSLVRRRDTSDGEPRFGMFETIRAFAAERLAAEQDAGAVRERHARHYVGLVERLHTSAEEGAREALDHLERDHVDLRAAIGWTMETGDLRVAVGLVAGLWRFWQKRGYLVEGRQQADRVVAALGPDAPDDLQVAALDALGGLTYWLGDQPAAQDAYGRALAVRRRQGDEAAIVEALYNLSFTYTFQSEPDEGLRLLDEAARILERTGDERGLARVLWARANLEWTSGDRSRAATARDFALRALALFERAGDQFMIAWSEYTAGLGALVDDDRPQTAQRMRRALRLFQGSGDVSGYTLALDAVSALLARTGDVGSAARLAGKVHALEATTGTGLNQVNRQAFGYVPGALAEDPATRDAFAEGERMPIEEAVALALRRLEPLAGGG